MSAEGRKKPALDLKTSPDKRLQNVADPKQRFHSATVNGPDPVLQYLDLDNQILIFEVGQFNTKYRITKD